MKSNRLGIAIGAEDRLRKAIETQVRREHQHELDGAQDESQKADVEKKIKREVKKRMKRVASPYSLWGSAHV